MKKVLIVLKHLSLGGAEKMFLRILESINLNTYSIHILLVFNERLQNLPNLPNLKITTIFEEKDDTAKLLIKKYPNKIYTENIKDMYDIEIAFLEGYPTRIIGASSNPYSLKIAFIHTDFRFFHHSLNAYTDSQAEESCYKKYTYIMYVSETACDGFHITYPSILPPKEYVFYPPLTEKMLISNQNRIDYMDAPPYFITLTRLAQEKGVFKLIEACKNIIELGYNVCFRIYGTGPLYNKLIEKIQSEHLEKFIYLMGYSQAPYVEMKNSLAYICPSDNESFCIAIEEALFLSVPVIACRCSGTEEILRNGAFGLLVENNSKGLSNGINQFLSNPNFSNILKHKAQSGKKYWKNILKSSNDFPDPFYQIRKSK